MTLWPKIPLGDLVLPTELRDPTKTPEIAFSYVDIASVDNETKTIVAAKRIAGSEAPSRARKVLRSGDVIVSTVRPNLNAVALVPPEQDNAICSTGFSVLRPSKRILSGYLFAFVRSRSFVELLVKSTTGANYPATTDGEVRAVAVPVPSLAEQNRIVRLLEAADELRNLRAQARRRVAALIPALFHEMFGSSKFRSGRVGDLTTLVTSGSTPRGGDQVYVSEGPYFIRSQNVRMNRLDLSDAVCLPPKVHEQMARTKVKKGDVLLNITGASIGRVAWVDRLAREANVSQHVCLIRPESHLLDPTYLSVFMSLSSTQIIILQVQAGASRQALNHQQVRALEIPIPPLVLQREFADRVTEIRELEAEQTLSANRVDQLFQSLLHSAFAGEP
jgi:type I restriction enzyme S subunit